MAQIERRQARIRRIRQRQQARDSIAADSDAATSLSLSYHLGSNQNHPEHIPLFLQRHAGDPAIEVNPSLDDGTTPVRITI